MDLATFTKLLKSRLEESGQSAAGAALRAGLPRDAIRSVLRGHPPTFTRAAEICEALGLEHYIGPRRDAPLTKSHIPRWAADFRSDLRAGVRVDMAQLLKGHHTGLAEIADRVEAGAEKSGLAPRADTEPKEWIILDALVSVPGHDRMVGERYVAFRRDWLARRGMTENCVVVSVAGRSMDPTLPPASSILLDRGHRNLEAGRVYLLRVETSRLLVRRASWELGQWMMATDKPKNDRQPWPENAEILGEVRFVSYAVQDEMEQDLVGG